MKLSPQSQALVDSVLRESISQLKKKGQPQVSDLHLMPKQSSGELVAFDDDDNELAAAVIPEWVDYGNGGFLVEAERLLRSALNALQKEGALDGLPLLKPYSFVLVDEDHEAVAELLLVDDDTLLLDDELLKGLDNELDDFLKKLLEE